MRSRKAHRQQPAERTDKKKPGGPLLPPPPLLASRAHGWRVMEQGPGELQPENVERTCTVAHRDHRVNPRNGEREHS